MPKAMLVDFAEGEMDIYTHDGAKRFMSNFHVEGHQWLSEHERGMDYDFFEEHKIKLFEFKSLTCVSELSFYILINHFAKHWGRLCFDLIDLSLLNTIDKDSEKISFIRNHNGLHVLESYCHIFKQLQIGEFKITNTKKEQELAIKLESLYFSPVSSFWQEQSLKRIEAGGLVKGHFFFYTALKNLFFDLDKTKLEYKQIHSILKLMVVHIFITPFKRLKRVIGGKN